MEETQEQKKQYNVGDDVIINSETLLKYVKGRIEQILEDQGRFLYSVYYSPEDLKQGRQSHHGKFEIFKTERIEIDPLDRITDLVEVLNFEDYVNKEPLDADSDQNQYYISRQFYDVEKDDFSPNDIEILNPDEEQEIKWKSLKRKSEYDNLEEELPDPMKEMVVVKKSKSTINSDRIKELYKKMMTDKNDDEEQIETEKNPPQSARSSFSRRKSETNNKTSDTKRDFKNINEEQVEKLQQLLDRYKFTSGTNKLQGIEKKRQEVKERFFQALVYGLEEMKNINYDVLTEQEQQLIATKDDDVYTNCRRMAIEIESTMFNLNNKGKKLVLEQSYRDRFKIIWTNIRDDKNFPLRQKVLTGVFKAKDLCTKDEKQLYNADKRQEVENIEKKHYEKNTIKEEFLLFKSNKGGIEIQDQSNDLTAFQNDENGKGNEERESATKLNQQKNNDATPIRDISNNFNYLKNNKLKQILEAKNDNIDKEVVNGLVEFLSEKAYRRMEQRIRNDLPDREAEILIEQLNLLS